MKWTKSPRVNIDDRRARSGVGRGTMGVGGLLVAVVLSLLFGKDFISGSGAGGEASPSGASGQEGELRTTAEEEHLADFMNAALRSQQETWRELLGQRYRDATLVFYRQGTESGCGYGESAVGPFYCPADGQVYLDLSFFAELDRRLGAPGDFAQAYVLAHEIGHHVQNLTGSSEGRGGRSNAHSVMTELQADCYAGIWAFHAARRGLLERGDVEEALGAATSIGDDTLQRKAGREVRPESFTHGSSAQRKAWFQRGHERGRVEDCDTFTE